MRTKLRSKLSLFFFALAALIAVPTAIGFASDLDTSSVDVNVPATSVTLAPGGSENITINMRVTGRQDAPAAFKIDRNYTLSGGTFTGSNPETFNVPARAAGAPATTFSTTGTVSVASDQADGGPFSLKVTPFDIDTTAPAALKVRTTDSYEVTVETPEQADTTDPTITLTTPPDNATYTKGQLVNADYSCADEEEGASGLASCVGEVDNGDPIDTSTVGEHTFTVDAADNAGNTAQFVHHYYVQYGFDGFRSPVDNLPTLNTVKAGSSVPVKFSLSDAQGETNQGLGIMAVDPDGKAWPRSIQAACDSTALTDAIEQTVTAGGSNLSYDPVAKQYNYVWKTDKAWAGTCRQLIVKLNDGTYHQANFKLTK